MRNKLWRTICAGIITVLFKIVNGCNPAFPNAYPMLNESNFRMHPRNTVDKIQYMYVYVRTAVNVGEKGMYRVVQSRINALEPAMTPAVVARVFR